MPNIDGNSLHIGDEILLEINLSEIDINRNITSTLLKDFEALMEKSLENQIYEQLKSHIGKIVNGMVIFVDKRSEDSIVEIDATRAKLPRKNRIKGEKFAVGENISCILKNIYFDKKYGIQIELSRTTPKFLEELLRLEVPEIADGEVSIIKCARIPGVRAKVAVQSNTPRVRCSGRDCGRERCANQRRKQKDMWRKYRLYRVFACGRSFCRKCVKPSQNQKCEN